jgi:hypothetical protein
MAEKKKPTAKKPVAKKASKLVATTKDGKKVYGPFKGSAANGGRPIYDVVNKDGSRTTVNKARFDYEKKTGKKVPKGTDVDHKDNNHNNDGNGNLRMLKHGKNTAKENKRRAGKKENEK